MTTIVADARIEAAPAAARTAGDGARGWYLYGVTRRGALTDVLAEADAGNQVGEGPAVVLDEAAPLELLEFAGLAAVVRPVLLADFSLAVVQERLRSPATLEAMVRGHNRVTAAVHRRQAILPAKFGMVYTHTGGLVSALRPMSDILLRRLDRLEGCDEWAIHVHADPAVVRERIATMDPAIRHRREECAAARPGRAFFLERQLRDELEDATQQALETVAQSALDRLAGSAVVCQVNPAAAVADAEDDVEILRAAFLVARGDVEHFQAEVRAVADAGAGLRCEQSGPWPPYSFAAWNDEEAE